MRCACTQIVVDNDILGMHSCSIAAAVMMCSKPNRPRLLDDSMLQTASLKQQTHIVAKASITGNKHDG